MDAPSSMPLQSQKQQLPPLADVQSQAPSIPLHINRVGIRNMTMPILVRQRDYVEAQCTVAEITLSVDLPAEEIGRAHV